MTALDLAVRSAMDGLGWERPCLVWVADYLRDETGRDFAAEWRGVGWTEPRSRRELARLALGGSGHTQVERAMDAMARRHGWPPVHENRQGAVMVGVFNTAAPNGSPAIFDGEGRWILGVMGGGLVTTGLMPDRAWEIVT